MLFYVYVGLHKVGFLVVEHYQNVPSAFKLSHGENKQTLQQSIFWCSLCTQLPIKSLCVLFWRWTSGTLRRHNLSRSIKKCVILQSSIVALIRLISHPMGRKFSALSEPKERDRIHIYFTYQLVLNCTLWPIEALDIDGVLCLLSLHMKLHHSTTSVSLNYFFFFYTTWINNEKVMHLLPLAQKE